MMLPLIIPSICLAIGLDGRLANHNLHAHAHPTTQSIEIEDYRSGRVLRKELKIDPRTVVMQIYLLLVAQNNLR